MNENNLHSAFGIPEGYFEDLENEIIANIEISESERELKSNGFNDLGLSTPNGYFGELEEESVNSILNNAPKLLKLRFIKTLGIAASLLVGIMVVTEFTPDPQASTSDFEELLSSSSITDELLDELSEDEFEDIILAANADNIIDESQELNSYLFLLEDEDILDEFSTELIEL